MPNPEQAIMNKIKELVQLGVEENKSDLSRLFSEFWEISATLGDEENGEARKTAMQEFLYLPEIKPLWLHILANIAADMSQD